MERVVFLASLIAAAVAVQVTDPDWESFKQKYGKQYEDAATEQKRYSIWKDNLAFIEEHNKEADQHGYELGINEYGDLTTAEFTAMMNGFKMEPIANFNDSNAFKSTGKSVPDSVDWREKGAVTEVKNQGQCGSCWAFSATGSMEGQHFLNGGGKLVSLSEQNLIDCAGEKYGNNGCSGGLMNNAFEYVIDNKGIDTEESYPYKAEEHKCHYNAADSGATIRKFRRIFHGDIPALTEVIAMVGPVSVGMDARWGTFHHYKSGVYSDTHCSSWKLDHGVLAVGYGTYQGKPYYLVKNSWGPSWGQEGYFMIERDWHNMCGIASQASWPIV